MNNNVTRRKWRSFHAFEAPPIDCVSLVDFGLALKYLTPDGTHKSYCYDERKAHAGTVLFCSLDAHRGAQSRRSDLESLGYNMIYWLTGYLPWCDHGDDVGSVERLKHGCLTDIDRFVKKSFPFSAIGSDSTARLVQEYFTYVTSLEFEDAPDYAYLHSILLNALLDAGHANDGALDFSRSLKPHRPLCENANGFRKLMTPPHALRQVMRSPLKSNLFIMPKTTRMKNKKGGVGRQCMNWSRILIDPECLLRRARQTDDSGDAFDAAGDAFTLADLDLDQMNATSAMWDVFNRWVERGGNSSPKYKETLDSDRIEGYNSTMMTVYRNMQARKALEEQQQMEIATSVKTSRKKRSAAVTKKSLVIPPSVKKERKRAAVRLDPVADVMATASPPKQPRRSLRPKEKAAKAKTNESVLICEEDDNIADQDFRPNGHKKTTRARKPSKKVATESVVPAVKSPVISQRVTRSRACKQI